MIAIVLALALAAAADPPPAGPAPKAETVKERKRREKVEARNKVECQQIIPTGSNLPQTVCLTRAQWDRAREDAYAESRTISDRDAVRPPR